MSRIAGDAKLVTVGDRTFEGGGPINAIVGGLKKTITALGNGGKLNKVERLPWKISGVKIPIDIDAGDFVYLQNIANSTEDVQCGFELQNGTAMTGTGSITGEVQYNGDTGMAEFDMEGVGTLEVM